MIPYACSDPLLSQIATGDQTLISEYVAASPGLADLLGAKSYAPTESPFLSVDGSNTEPFPPQWLDLIRLHYLVRSRRVTTVLEFGVGHSSGVIAHALAANREEFGMYVKEKLRRSNAFELHTVDESEHWIEAAEERLSSQFTEHTTFYVSPVRMTTFNGRICTEYQRLPNICPDFIYLDAPAQWPVSGDVNGISTNHPDRLPMACDLIKIEHFLLPGTLIVVDGRTANARFLKTNFQRNWAHFHDVDSDVHYFELIELPLGRWNRRQVEFCLGVDWLAHADFASSTGDTP